MKKLIHLKTDAMTVPTTQAEAEVVLAEIGHLQRQAAILEAEMNDRLIELKDRYTKQVQLLNGQIETKFHALHAWAEANRSRLLKEGLKTLKLSTGELNWRLTPHSVHITNAVKVLDTLKRLGLTHFIRTREEINKEAILAEPAKVEGVAGIAVSQHEEFVAKPFESQVERAELVTKVERVA